MKPATIALLLTLCFATGAAGQTRRILTLEECRQTALQNNNDIRNANLDITAAIAKKKEVASNFFPNVSLLGFAFHSFDHLIQKSVSDILGKNDFGYDMQYTWEEIAPELGASETFNYLRYGQRYGVTIIQPVFLGGRIFNGNRYASLGISAARLMGHMKQRDVIEQVDKTYYDLAALQEKQKTVQALAVLLDSLEKVADIALSQGVILKSDQMLLQTKKLELMNGQTKLKAGIRLSKMNLLNTIGLEYRAINIDSYEFPGAVMDSLPTPEQVYVYEEDAAANLDETQLLDLQIEAKKFEKKLTIGSSLPQIGIGLTYGYTRLSEINPGRWNGTVFAAVQIPLSDWVRNTYKLQQQQADLEKAVNDRDHLGRMLVLQQRKLFFDLTSAWDDMQLAKTQAEYHQYLYDQARLNYETGYSTVTDMLMAYGDLAEAQENYCTSVGSYLTALQAYTIRLK